MRASVLQTSAIPSLTRQPESLFSEHKFAKFDLHESLKVGLRSLAIESATQIQAKSFVPITLGKDVALCSETGSGKTVAYLLPLLNRMLFQRALKPAGGLDLLGRSSPPVVVVCPTAELCKQVVSVARSMDSQRLVSSQSLLDLGLKAEGVTVGPRIRWGAVDLVVTTPTRFAEDIERFRQDNLAPSCVVIDEADYTLCGATQEAMRTIVEYFRNHQRSVTTPFVFASATMPESGMRSAASLIAQSFPTTEIVKTSKFHSVPSGIAFHWLPELAGSWDQRCFLLTQTLGDIPETDKTLVFVNTHRNAKVLYTFLKEKKWPVVMFTKKSGGDSEHLFHEDARVVIATDLGGRGIDYAGGVDVVVNFQMPTDSVTWLHRVGRCGRLGRTGKVISFFKQADEALVNQLKTRIDVGMDVESTFPSRNS